MSESDTNTSSKRRRLGRGLSGMIGNPVAVDTSPSSPTPEQRPPTPALTPTPAAPAQVQIIEEQNQSEYKLTEISVSSIIPNRNQPRQAFDPESLKALARSIVDDGLMQPVVVRPGSGSGGTGGRYELIAGERRWRAAKIAGLERIPAIVREAGDRDAAELALIENIHRQDLNAIERGEALAQLVGRFGLTQQEVADKLGMDRSSVANLMRLTELEDEIRTLIVAGELGAGHGKALLGLAPGQSRVDLAIDAAKHEWSVRELERRAKDAQAGKPASASPEPARRSAVHADLERRLGDRLGTKVKIQTNRAGTKGKLVIEFYGIDHFDGLVRELGVGE
ncbi:MAG: ParB/RepB/Spo0J family partition protein [Phycisphaerales bacterium]|nr:ParB/RepB/Spo0J family partition protein [Phycisphaerales bacterium]MCB9835877.1 ParB/RepB/Spo0J family partition protein [Phycisphaera sp.]